MAIEYGRPLEPTVRFSPSKRDRRAERAVARSHHRHRRNRKSEWARRMVRETCSPPMT